MIELTKNINAIEVPMEAYNFDIGYDFDAGKLEAVYQFQKTGNKFEDMCRKSTEISISNWVPHSIKILGTCTNGVIDFDVSGIVEKATIVDGKAQYMDYLDVHYGKTYSKLNPTDSFLSLLTSKSVDWKNKKWLIIQRSVS